MAKSTKQAQIEYLQDRVAFWQEQTKIARDAGEKLDQELRASREAAFFAQRQLEQLEHMSAGSTLRIALGRLQREVLDWAGGDPLGPQPANVYMAQSIGPQEGDQQKRVGRARSLQLIAEKVLGVIALYERAATGETFPSAMFER